MPSLCHSSNQDNAIRLLACITIFLAFGSQCFCQEWKNSSTDELFSQARSEAFEGKYEESRKKLYHILDQHPQHLDARLLISKTFSWAGQYGDAREELAILVEQLPGNREVIDVMIDVELWSREYERALELISSIIAQSPDDVSLLFKKATALSAQGNSEESIRCLRLLLALDPAHAQAITLQQEILSARLKYTAGLIYSMDLFNDTFDPAHSMAVQFSRLNTWGSSIVRVNVAQRFNASGAQYETELYPKISKRVYAYINYGYSESELFPAHRLGVETYAKLLRRFEASAGIRYMDFNDVNVLIYTGSLGWYVKNYWVSLRPYVTSDPISTNGSATVFIRRYFRNPENFVGLIGGFGFSPDFARLQTGYGLGGDNVHKLNSQRTGIVFQKVFQSKWVMNLSFEVARQDLSDETGPLLMTTSTLGLKRKF